MKSENSYSFIILLLAIFIGILGRVRKTMNTPRMQQVAGAFIINKTATTVVPAQ